MTSGRFDWLEPADWLGPVDHTNLGPVKQLAQASCTLLGMAAEKPEDRRPASRRVADELRDAIDRGDLAAGARLPSERDLAEEHGIARNTAREAIRLLSDEGLVMAEHGRGVFVRPAAPLIRLGNDRYSRAVRESGTSPFLAECARQGKTGRFEVLSIQRMAPPPEVAERLNLPTTTKSVVRRENVFYADADPVHRVTTWIPWTIAQGTGLMREQTGHPYGIHGILEDKGHVMTRLREEISARMPRPDEREHLQIPPGVPVLDVLHTSLDADGNPYELTRFVMRADMTSLLYNSPVE
jgi:GntR family transcriptional regulator